jgi:hypothetical protein
MNKHFTLFGFPFLALCPMLVPGVVVGLAMVVRVSLRIDDLLVPQELLDSAVVQDVTLDLTARHYAVRSQWAASLLVWSAAMLAGCFFALSTTRQTWKRLGKPSLAMNGLLVVVSLFVAAAVGHTGNTALLGPGIQAQLFQWVERWTGFPVVRLVLSAIGTSAGVMLLGSAAVSSLLVGLDGEVDVTALKGRYRRLRTLLWLGNMLLIIGVVTTALFFQIPRTLVTGPTCDAIAHMASGTIMMVGVFYTLQLAAVFGPAEYILHRKVRESALVSENPDKWLSDNGLQAGLTSSLARVLAVFSPLITGVIGSVLSLK